MNSIPRDNAKRPPASAGDADLDRPLELEPDDEEERQGYGWNWSQRTADRLQLDEAQSPTREVNSLVANDETAFDPNDVSVVDRSAIGSEAGHMSDVLRWALDSLHEPAIAAADWLARDIDPEQPTASALLTNPDITLLQAKQAKSVFKTMRIVGEKSADRRVGARMYAAAIAAALVRHQRLISRQSPDALKRGFQGLLDDHRMTQPLRDLAGMAMCALSSKQFKVDSSEPQTRPNTSRPETRRSMRIHARNGRDRDRGTPTNS